MECHQDKFLSTFIMSKANKYPCGKLVFCHSCSEIEVVDIYSLCMVNLSWFSRAGPIVRALDLGADVVITGRCVDSALVLGPLMHQVKNNLFFFVILVINHSRAPPPPTPQKKVFFETGHSVWCTYFSYFLQVHYKYMKATIYTEHEQKHSKGYYIIHFIHDLINIPTDVHMHAHTHTHTHSFLKACIHM